MTWLLYRQADVLRPHLERLPPLPAQVRALAVADKAALVAQTLMAFSGQAAAASQVHAADSVAKAVASGRRVVETSLGALSFLLKPGDRSCTELVMGDIGTPAAIPDDAEPGANVVVLELPGHGASSGFAPLDILSGTWLRALPEALQSLGVDGVHLRGKGGACAFAAALALLLGPRCRRLSLTDPMPLTADERAQFLSGLPDWQPQATGAHLIAAWNWARLQHLFWPWLPADADAAIAAAAPPPRRVHADVVEMLRAGPLWAALWQAALESDTWPAVRRAPFELRVLSGSSQQRMALAARLGGEGLVRTTLAPVVNR